MKKQASSTTNYLSSHSLGTAREPTAKAPSTALVVTSGDSFFLSKKPEYTVGSVIVTLPCIYMQTD